MSIVLNGSSQHAHRSVAGSPVDYCVAGWVKCTSGAGTRRDVFKFAGGFGTGTYIASSNGIVPQHNFSVGGAALGDFTVDVWRYVMVRYVDEVQRLRTLNDGGTDWANVSEQTGLSDLTLTDLILGSETTAGANRLPGIIANCKVWIGTLPSESDVLAERLNTDVTVTTGLYAAYDFLDGELATDRSGSSLNLTLVGTPTYSADKPDDLTIGGSPSGPTAGVVRNYRRNQLLIAN